jgi:biotin carboxyl carrier protein
MTVKTIPALVGKDVHGGDILRAPKLGLYADRPRDGFLVEPGVPIGTLTQLRHRYVLVVPDGVTGRVAATGRAQDAFPVDYGETLFALTAISGSILASTAGDAKAAGMARNALEVVAPTDGVFYRAPAVDAKPYCVVGDRISVGRPIGLIEVMKTFNPIVYGGAGFPDEAEVVEVLAADAQEVRAGQALVVLKRLEG